MIRWKGGERNIFIAKEDPVVNGTQEVGAREDRWRFDDDLKAWPSHLSPLSDSLLHALFIPCNTRPYSNCLGVAWRVLYIHGACTLQVASE